MEFKNKRILDRRAAPLMCNLQVLVKERANSLEDILKEADQNNDQLKYEVEEIEVQLEDLEKTIKHRGVTKVPGEKIHVMLK